MMATQCKEKQLKQCNIHNIQNGGHYSLWCQISPNPVL